MKVSGIKQLSLSHAAHKWIANQVCVVSKIPAYLPANTASPCSPRTMTRVLCFGPHGIILIHLPPDSRSQMKTSQKLLVRLTLRTPTVAWAPALLHGAYSPPQSGFSWLFSHRAEETASPRFKASHPWQLPRLPRPCINRTKGRNHRVGVQKPYKAKLACAALLEGTLNSKPGGHSATAAPDICLPQVRVSPRDDIREIETAGRLPSSYSKATSECRCLPHSADEALL